ncbi:MAG: PDZ domain-containing protein [Bdellovibrionales bacterium]|nr:PDZ domain-containing protein [Bdellovibrionales bacterium]
MFFNFFQKKEQLFFSILKTSLFFFFSFVSLFVQSLEITCRDIHKIQQEFLNQHIVHKKLTDELKKRVINQLINDLDGEKIYFLESDVNNIKKSYKRIFNEIKQKRCIGLYTIYTVYQKRVKELTNFAEKYLAQVFQFNKSLTYVLDDEINTHPKSITEAKNKMISYIQYHIANIFLFEKELPKSVQQFLFILQQFNKQVTSWKPVLNSKELRECRKKNNYALKTCKPGSWFSNYLNSYSKSLDSHSSFMDAKDIEEFRISMNLELEGIGATLSSKFGYTVVEKLIAGGAAERSKKIQVKDKILAVGQTSTNLIDIFGENIEDVVSLIRGPKGTLVYLKISRPQKNKKNKIFTVKLTRSHIDLKEEEASISYHNIKGKNKNYKVGLIHVPSFYGSNFFSKSVSRDVKKLLQEADEENIEALVLDLSSNRGGSLDEAIYLSGLFFSKGNVVKQSERRSGDSKIRFHLFKDRDEKIFYNKALVVLVNRLSASASEIVSGALQDYKRAVIVGGNHTFGKGSVQSVQPIGKIGALKTTIGLYFIPSGRSTQKIGVTSDIIFPSLFNLDTIGEKNLDHVLNYKNIKSFKSEPDEIFKMGKNNWQAVDYTLIQRLKKLSENRVKQNPKFKDIQKKMKDLQEKERKTIQIAEILKDENKILKEESETKEDEIIGLKKDKKKYFTRPDIQEALQIAKDLAMLQKIKSTRNYKNNHFSWH